MHWLEILLYLGSGAVFIAFWMKTMIPLRLVGIGSNIIFLVYGLFDGLLPVILLHGALLPLNIFRLNQAVNLRRRIRAMAHSDFDVKSLLSFMNECQYPQASMLFQRGDEAHDIYYLAEGRAHIVELDIDLEPGQLIGEIALFSPNKKRTQTVRCTKDCVFLSITNEKILQMCLENPEFGLFLVKMIVDRLLSNLEVQAAPAG